MTDRSDLVGRLRELAGKLVDGGRIAADDAALDLEQAAALIESPPIQGLPENISEQLDLLVACAKPASGKNSARVAAGLVRDYIADLIRERDEARVAQSSPPAGEIQGLVERAMALTKRHGGLRRSDESVDALATRYALVETISELCEAITRLSQPSEKAKP